DFFVVPTLAFRLLFVFVVLRHDRRELVYLNVTDHPTALRTARQRTIRKLIACSGRAVVVVQQPRLTARSNERGCHAQVGSRARSTRYRAPDGFALHGSALRTRRGRGAADASRKGSDGRDTPSGSSARSAPHTRWHSVPGQASARSAPPRLGRCDGIPPSTCRPGRRG